MDMRQNIPKLSLVFSNSERCDVILGSSSKLLTAVQLLKKPLTIVDIKQTVCYA